MQIIYYNNQLNQWQLNTHKITYTQHDKSNIVSYTHDLQWWGDFVQNWSHTTIDSIEELQFTPEQLTRLEHIKYLPEDFGHIYSHYVETGEIHEDVNNLLPSHPFHVISLKHKEVKDLENKLLTPTEIYSRLDIESTPLEQLKQFKKNQLDYLCTQTILGRFSVKLNGNIYEFSNDTEAQLRFTGIGVMFMDNKISEIEWTTYLNGERMRITLDKSDFDLVSHSALLHQNTNIVKYNNLLKVVNDCMTNEEVNSVTW